MHATINGLGERAGNASLEELVMALSTRYNISTNIQTELLVDMRNPIKILFFSSISIVLL